MKEVADLNMNGCATVKELKQSCSRIPDCKGIYFILREFTNEVPKFRENGAVKMHDGKLLDYPVDLLESKWVDDTQIIYIGKTDSSLRKRLGTYMRFGQGKDAPHRGGRAIWQLPDSDEFVVGWRFVGANESARDLENRLLVEFKNHHRGKLPFANFVE